MTDLKLETVDLKTGVHPSSVSMTNKTWGLYRRTRVVVHWSDKLVTINLMEEVNLLSYLSFAKKES
jgi:hypothetical protein